VRIESIVGMEDEDALKLVDDSDATRDAAEIRVSPQMASRRLVLWDNRSVMHQANPDYDMNERRFLYRLMLKGEVPE